MFWDTWMCRKCLFKMGSTFLTTHGSFLGPGEAIHILSGLQKPPMWLEVSLIKSWRSCGFLHHWFGNLHWFKSVGPKPLVKNSSHVTQAIGDTFSNLQTEVSNRQSCKQPDLWWPQRMDWIMCFFKCDTPASSIICQSKMQARSSFVTSSTHWKQGSGDAETTFSWWNEWDVEWYNVLLVVTSLP